MNWLPEMDTRLSELWDEGKLTKAIAVELAAEFGVPVTKNAICGRGRRIGLVPRQPVKPKTFSFGKYDRLRAKRPYQKPEPELAVEIEPLNIPFMAIAAGQCREVVGEPRGVETLFCGHPQKGGSSYCKFHHARNTTTVRGHVAPSSTAVRTRETGEPLRGCAGTVEPVAAAEDHQDTQPIAA
jgi:GcrA cell cycle regulator